MRVAFLLVLLLASSSYQKINVKELGQVFEGVLEGVASGAKLQDITSCIKDAVQDIEKIDEAVKDLLKKDATHVLEALKLIAEALETLPSAIKECKAGVAEAERLIALLKNFKSPISYAFHVGKDLIVNGVQIYKDVAGAVSAFQSAQYKTFGFDIGQALALVFIGYKTTEYEQFKGLTTEEFRRKFLGLRNFDMSGVRKVNHEDMNLELPASFDWRKKSQSCPFRIRDQQQCGSCWAFGAIEALTDRLCIQLGIDVVLSPQHLVSCDDQNMGCNGGYLPKAWEFLESTGVPTEKCDPYTSGSGSSGSCNLKCKDGSTSQIYKAKDVVQPSSVTAIKKEILANGPVETGFQVYSDFMTYKGGVYRKKSNQFMGGHAVKILGWGSDSKGEYWICANSWNTSWGENGFFRIGVEECGISEQVIAGTPLKPQSITFLQK